MCTNIAYANAYHDKANNYRRAEIYIEQQTVCKTTAVYSHSRKERISSVFHLQGMCYLHLNNLVLNLNFQHLLQSTAGRKREHDMIDRECYKVNLPFSETAGTLNSTYLVLPFSAIEVPKL